MPACPPVASRSIKTVRSLGYIFKPPASGLVGGPGYKFDSEDEDEFEEATTSAFTER